MVLKTGYLFSGQLSETPKMGLPYNEYPSYRKAKEEYDDLTEGYFSFWTEEENEEGIHDRFKASEGNFLFNLAIARTLKGNGIIPAMIAGYSIGFFSACVFAGCLNTKDALTLIMGINEINKKLFPPNSHLLAAETGLNSEDLKIFFTANCLKGLEICNINNSRQVVFTGSDIEIEKAIKLLYGKVLSARKLQLDVPLHSSFMEKTCNEIEPLFQQTAFFNPEIPVVTAMPGTEIRNGDDARYALLNQIRSTINLPFTVDSMIKSGITNFIEVGPSDVISRMTKWIKRDIRILTSKEAITKKCS